MCALHSLMAVVLRSDMIDGQRWDFWRWVWWNIALSPPTVGRKTQICNLIHQTQRHRSHACWWCQAIFHSLPLSSSSCHSFRDGFCRVPQKIQIMEPGFESNKYFSAFSRTSWLLPSIFLIDLLTEKYRLSIQVQSWLICAGHSQLRIGPRIQFIHGAKTMLEQFG